MLLLPSRLAAPALLADATFAIHDLFPSLRSRCRACRARCRRSWCLRPALPSGSLAPFTTPHSFDGQVQSLPGALPAQLVRPGEGKVTWILDADAAAGIAAEKWEEPAKTDFPRSNV